MNATRALMATALLSLPMIVTLPSEARGETPPEAVVDAFHAALAAGDRAAALSRLDPAAIIFEGGGAEMSRDEYAHHHLGGDMEFSAAVDREITERFSSSQGQLAWVVTRSRTRGTYRERALDLAGTETMILRRSGDGWRIVHVHWSSRPAG